MKGNVKRFTTFILMTTVTLATVNAKETRKEREERIWRENTTAAQKAYAEPATNLTEKLYAEFEESRERLVKAEESLKAFEAHIEEEPELMILLYGGEEALQKELESKKEYIWSLKCDLYARYKVLTGYMDYVEETHK